MAKYWTDRDKKRVRAVLTKVAKAYGGWQRIADLLEMEGASRRATVESWHRRGRVPVNRVAGVMRLAESADPKIDTTAGELNSAARTLQGVK